MISNFRLQDGTKGVYRGTNCQDRVTIIKDIGCWTLEICHSVTDRCIHLSSHNTWDEAVRNAEVHTAWTVDLNFRPITQ